MVQLFTELASSICLLQSLRVSVTIQGAVFRDGFVCSFKHEGTKIAFVKEIVLDNLVVITK